MLTGLHDQALALLQIIVIDVVLAGDNAIVVGMAASAVAPELRRKVIIWGIGAAVVLRILFSVVATKLLVIVGLTLAGGILLLWVCWKMYREVIGSNGAHEAETDAPSGIDPANTVGFRRAVTNIMLADVSMSLDNVLAVAGAAKGHTGILVIGLALSVLLMGWAATVIARLLKRYPWITWFGLLIILYVAVDMIWRGSHQVACNVGWPVFCKHTMLEVILGVVKP
jgi:YjbE family integral membrane protein